MQRIANLYGSSIGKKVVMATTEAILVLFVLVHMLGNLKVFRGPEKIDTYGEFLREVGHPVFGHNEFLWIFRIVLLLAVALHFISATQLTVKSWKARPVGYRKQESVASTYASRTMRWGGIIIGAFVVYHILHFTTGAAHPDFHHGQVYRNLIIGFQSWPVSIAYVVAMIFVGLHLYHGIWSGLHTLGVDNPRYNAWRRGLSATVAIAVAAGNISIPVAVLAGIIHL